MNLTDLLSSKSNTRAALAEQLLKAQADLHGARQAHSEAERVIEGLRRELFAVKGTLANVQAELDKPWWKRIF